MFREKWSFFDAYANFLRKIGFFFQRKKHFLNENYIFALSFLTRQKTTFRRINFNQNKIILEQNDENSDFLIFARKDNPVPNKALLYYP